MTEAVIVAIITAVGAIIAELLISKASTKELYAKLDKQSEVTDTKLNGRIDVIQADIRTLSNRVEAHNKVVERTYELERRMSVSEERISDVHHRINELRDDGK